MENIFDKRYNVKIVRYCSSNGEVYQPWETVYWRYKMPYRLVVKYQWYFEYLCALAKTKSPRDKFRLTIMEWDPKFLSGREYEEAKIPGKLKSRLLALRKAEAEIPELDLFGFSEKAKDERIAKLKGEIQRLEQGCWDYPTFDTYINRIVST